MTTNFVLKMASMVLILQVILWMPEHTCDPSEAPPVNFTVTRNTLGSSGGYFIPVYPHSHIFALISTESSKIHFNQILLWIIWEQGTESAKRFRDPGNSQDLEDLQSLEPKPLPGVD